MSNRRAQDERIEGTPDGVNAITEIVDVPDAPIIGTATAGLLSASVAFTPATTGGGATLYTAVSTPGSIGGTSATSPISVSGLSAGTAYTFTVTPSNSTGTGRTSSSSNSVTPTDLVGEYDALATVNVSSSVSSVTFTGIPNNYSHLQLRAFWRLSAGVNLQARYNDSGAGNYKTHLLGGDGASIYAGITSVSPDYVGLGYTAGPNGTSCVTIADILDYSNTEKNKTTRYLMGNDRNGAGEVEFGSALWLSTSAINKIDITVQGGSSTIQQYSSFSLYGVK